MYVCSKMPLSLNITCMFKYNNLIINDSTTIDDKFNDYFANVGPLLANKIPTIDATPASYLN